MEYSKLISVTGKSGLFELVSSKTDGALVKQIEDKTISFVSSRIHQFSHLESIQIYTTGENVNLIEIFEAMEKTTEPIPSEKDTKATKAFFEKVFPTMDFDRVYDSDRKKMIKWFNILKANNIELKLSEAAKQEQEEG